MKKDTLMCPKNGCKQYFNLNMEVVNLQYLRKKYGKELKPAKQLEIESMIRSFAEMAYKKYALGAREHKDDLTVEVARKEIMSEVIDLVIYSMKAGL